MREADVQHGVVDFYQTAGGVVCDLSQGFRPGGRRHGTTRQTKGLGDLYVFFPYLGFALWHETKASDRPPDDPKRQESLREKQSDEQRWFEDQCRACRVPYVLGGVAEAVAALEQLRKVA